jgi:hypothetical protein
MGCSFSAASQLLDIAQAIKRRTGERSQRCLVMGMGRGERLLQVLA